MFLKKIAFSLAIAAVLSCTAYAEARLEEQISYTYNQNGFKLEAQQSFDDLDRISVTVLKVNKTFDDIKSESDINSENVLDMQVYYGNELSKNIYSWNTEDVEKLPVGWYNIKLTCTGLDGSVESEIFKYPNISDDDINGAWDAFAKAKTSVDFKNAWESYAEKLYYKDDYKEIFDNYLNLGELYLKIRDSVFDISGKESFSIEEDIIKCCGYALSSYALEGLPKNEAKIIFDKYGLPYGEVYDYKDFEAFYTIFSKAESDISSGDFSDTLKKIYAYANLQDGSVKKTVSNVADTLNKHYKELGIDLSYASGKNVDINAVAAKINTSDAYSYYKNANWFEGIVNGLAGNNNGNTVVVGGGVGGSGYSTPVKPSTELKKEEEQNVGFSDMGNHEWARESVERLCEKGILNGTGNGKFSPGSDITREQFIAMAVRAFDIKIENGREEEFSDVEEDAWFGEYVKIASSRGIVSGIGDGKFGTGLNITRQDMAVILLNVMKMKNLSIVPEKSGFEDRSSVADYAVIAVDTLSQLKIINGFDDNTFMPYGNATRAEASVMLDRMLTYINGGQ